MLSSAANPIRPGKTTVRLSKGVFLIMMFSLGILLTQQVRAQRTVVVEPDNYPAEVGSLNITIESDTTATGERVDENTIYVLKRDAVYWLDATITNTGYHLRIEAEEGDGHPPVIRPAVDLVGSSNQLFRTGGDFTIRGLYLSHIDEQGALQKNPIRVSGEDSRVIIDQCWLDYDEQSWVRIDNTNIKVYITNTAGRNNGRNDGSGNGRIIDTRGIETDTLWLVNNTFYNLQQNPIRTDQGVTHYLKMDHNTIVDAAGGFSLGKVIELEFTNNLFTNVGFKGIGYGGTGLAGTDGGAMFEFTSVEEIEGVTDADRKITISNNNFERAIDQLSNEELGPLMGPYRTEIQEIIDEGPDSVIINRPLLDSTAAELKDESIIMMDNNIVEGEDVLGFSDRPDYPTIVAFLDHMVFHSDEVDSYPLMWDKPETRVEGSTTADWRDFSYSTSSASYTTAEGGFPVGDLNWFPDKKTEWEAYITPVEEEKEHVVGFTLHQNYPNPFNPSTTIVVEMEKPAALRLDVYDVMGRKIQTLFNGSRGEGSHVFHFNATQLSSGLYIARLKVGEQAIRSIRMTLIK